MLTTLFKRLFSFFIAFIVFANAVQAQKTVSGKVTDADQTRSLRRGCGAAYRTLTTTAAPTSLRP